MGGQFARRKRHRPRRRRRYRGNGLGARRGSFQAFGLHHFYNLFVPRGRGRRLFFNEVCGVMTWWFGLVGGIAGYGMAGVLGVVPGFGFGMVLGARFLGSKGYFRP